MKNAPLPRLDVNPDLREALLPFCRLRAGEVWQDPQSGHSVGCLASENADRCCLCNITRHMFIILLKFGHEKKGM